MSIQLLRLATEHKDGSKADGWSLVIELFGVVLEIGVAK